MALFALTTTQVNAAPIALGTYTAYTEAESSVGFELFKSGDAMIITEASYEIDATNKRVEDEKRVKGKWEQKGDSLILSFGNFKDEFTTPKKCVEKLPCFKYAHSLQKNSKQSPLNVEYDFLNWTGKKPKHHSASSPMSK